MGYETGIHIGLNEKNERLQIFATLPLNTKHLPEPLDTKKNNGSALPSIMFYINVYLNLTLVLWKFCTRHVSCTFSRRS